MRYPPKTKLQKQTEVWYKKLKEKGFEDIEYSNGDLKAGIPEYLKKNGGTAKYFAIQEYYYMAQNFLNEYKFESELERIIWTYHTEGIGVRSISLLLKQAKVAKLERMAIWSVVAKLRNKMKDMYLK